MNAERLHITKSIHLFASQHDKTQQTSSQEGEETEIASSALLLLQGRPIVWVARRAAAWTRSLKINPVFSPTMSCESSVIPMASWPIWARWRIQGFATPLLESSIDVFFFGTFGRSSTHWKMMKDEKQKPHILHLRDKMLSLSPEVTEWIGGITLNLFVLQSECVGSSH